MITSVLRTDKSDTNHMITSVLRTDKSVLQTDTSVLRTDKSDTNQVSDISHFSPSLVI